MSQPTSPTVSAGTPVACDTEERQLGMEHNPMDGLIYTDNETQSIGGNSIGCPPPVSPVAQTSPFLYQMSSSQQPGMMYPSTEAVMPPAGHHQMMWFNPAAMGYTNTSHGFDPREGYPVVYPYVPMPVPIEKKKRGFCC
ncbi:hypothetical protein BESB_060040 [Besnoitia besnoiti]|uniref:Uncharacterized protein n=1 Tax=Besnoitia besnoiti TaxID=94643 RepID=A0A2A9MHQ0_BESBE|nr:hypothetical protein BESB_060040 [Besnoitia besnoiti]PFH35117.1 hypothetical protein BESB_060040 [Besnoitia besnoiti]